MVRTGRSGDEWRCPICHQVHQGLATVFGPKAPEAWVLATEAQRREGTLSPDLCVLTTAERERYFLRGHVEIPVADPQMNPFVWSAWVELDRSDVEDLVTHWNDPGRVALPPMHGTLASELPYAASTLELRVAVVNRDVGEVPRILLDAGVTHELAVEQRVGITPHRVAEFNRHVMGS